MDPELTIFENEHVIAQISLNHKSGNHGHTLVIPKKHIQNIYELPADLDAPLMSALRLLSRAVKKPFPLKASTFVKTMSLVRNRMFFIYISTLSLDIKEMLSKLSNTKDCLYNNAKNLPNN